MTDNVIVARTSAFAVFFHLLKARFLPMRIDTLYLLTNIILHNVY